MRYELLGQRMYSVGGFRKVQLGVDVLDKVGKSVWAIMTPAIDEECRRSIHTAAQSSHEVGADFGPERAILQRFRQTCLGEVQRFGEDKVEGQAQILLVFEEAVMHLPESLVRACELGCLGCAFGMGMDLRKRKMSENEAELAAVMSLHGLNDRKGKAAGGAFIIPILNKRDGGTGVALDVIG
jgi:hypothetical protein